MVLKDVRPIIAELVRLKKASRLKLTWGGICLKSTKTLTVRLPEVVSKRL